MPRHLSHGGKPDAGVSSTAVFRLSNPAHEDARQELLRKYGTPSNNCMTFTRRFAEQFSDLKRVCGFYYAPNFAASHGEHWWLVDQQGAVVDPTADQFASAGTGHYVPYDPEKHQVVKGKCMHCGQGLFSRIGAYPCSRECDEAIVQEYECRLSGGPYEEDMTFSCDADITRDYGIVFPLPC